MEKRALTAAILILAAALISGCGGGGTFQSPITPPVDNPRQVSGRIANAVSTSPGAASRVADSVSLSGLSVSVSGCTGSGTTDTSGNFNFDVNDDCSGARRILKAVSTDETRLAEKIVSVASSGDVSLGQVVESDTVKTILVMRIAKQITETFPEYQTEQAALAAMDQTLIDSVTGEFDSDSDGSLGLDDLDGDSDGTLEQSELVAKDGQVNDMVASTLDGLSDFITLLRQDITESAIPYEYMTSYDTAFYDMGTPSDTSDDVIFKFVWIRAVAVSDETTSAVDSSTAKWRARLTDSYTKNETNCYPYEGAHLIDNYTTFTLSKSGGVWKIASILMETGNLSISAAPFRSVFSRDSFDAAPIFFSLTNEGPARIQSYYPDPVDDDAGFIVTRPDGKTYYYKTIGDRYCSSPSDIALGPGESLTYNDYNIDLFFSPIQNWSYWAETEEEYSSGTPTTHALDIDGIYTFRYVYNFYTSISNCYFHPLDYPNNCIFSEPATFEITD